jgi:hypothetical protein
MSEFDWNGAEQRFGRPLGATYRALIQTAYRLSPSNPARAFAALGIAPIGVPTENIAVNVRLPQDVTPVFLGLSSSFDVVLAYGKDAHGPVDQLPMLRQSKEDGCQHEVDDSIDPLCEELGYTEAQSDALLDCELLRANVVIAKNLAEFLSLLVTKGDMMLCRHLRDEDFHGSSLLTVSAHDEAGRVRDALLQIDGVHVLSEPQKVVRALPKIRLTFGQDPRQKRYNSLRKSKAHVRFFEKFFAEHPPPLLRYKFFEIGQIGFFNGPAGMPQEELIPIAREAVWAWNRKTPDFPFDRFLIGNHLYNLADL